MIFNRPFIHDFSSTCIRKLFISSSRDFTSFGPVEDNHYYRYDYTFGAHYEIEYEGNVVLAYETTQVEMLKPGGNTVL